MPEEKTLRNFLELVESQLDLTEPMMLDDGTCAVALAPGEGGMVGIDADTGRPMQINWRYKTIDQKPVIINAGNKQTVIPPKPPLPPPPPAHIVDIVMAGALYEAMTTRFRPGEHGADVGAKKAFVQGCLANPDFYMKWQARLAVLEAKEKFMREGPPTPLPPAGAWPSPPRVRQRVVDT